MYQVNQIKQSFHSQLISYFILFKVIQVIQTVSIKKVRLGAYNIKSVVYVEEPYNTLGRSSI